MKFFFFTFIVSFSAITNAQWSVNPELGTNVIQTSKLDNGNNFQLGWHVGAALEYEISEIFSISSGLYATQKKQSYRSLDTSQFSIFGFEAQFDSLGLSRDVYTRTEGNISQFYLELPVLANFTFDKITLFAGPAVGYAFSVRRKETKNMQTPLLQIIDLNQFGIDPNNPFLGALLPPANETTFEESSDDVGLRKIDIGVKAGIRYMTDEFNIGIAYYRGFLPFEIDVDDSPVHQYVQATLGYRLPF